MGLILCQEGDGGLIALGVDDELRIVGASHLWRIGIHESGRCTADEACDTLDAIVLLQHMLHRVGYQLRLSHSLAIGQEYLHSKLIAIGIREESYLQRGGYQTRQQNHGDTSTDGDPGVGKGPVEHLVVCTLHPLGDGVSVSTNLIGSDDASLEERNDCNSQHQRYHQVDGNGDGEVLQTVMEHALHRDEEGVEDGADANGGQHHRHEILLSRLDGGIVGLETLIEVFQITIDHHNRVVDNHSQYHDQGRERDNVQFDTHHIHEGYTHKCAQRNGDGCHNSRSDGEEHHHHEDNDQHGNQQIAQEVAYTLHHHLGLIRNAGHLHILGQLVLAEVIQHLIHLLAIFHHIVAWCHLHRQQYAGMAVLFYSARHGFILTHHFGDVSYPCHLARHRVGEDNLISDLLLRILRILYVDRYLLVIVAD